MLLPTEEIYKLNLKYPRANVSGETLKRQSSPLLKGDHLELDDSEFISEEDKAKYMSMIGTAQWLVKLRRLDITIAMSTLSSYRVAPQEGHVEYTKPLYRYIKHFPHAAVQICTDIPDYSEMIHESHEWLHSIYSNIEEELPLDMPPSLARIVHTSSLFNANLYHDLIMGCTMIGILHLMNPTPIIQYCKKQTTVATATYSSEFIAIYIIHYV